MRGTNGSDDRRSLFVALRLYGVVVASGMEIVIIPLGGFLLDRYLQTLPWLTILGFVIGFSGGLYHLYVGIKAALKKD